MTNLSFISVRGCYLFALVTIKTNIDISCDMTFFRDFQLVVIYHFHYQFSFIDFLHEEQLITFTCKLFTIASCYEMYQHF